MLKTSKKHAVLVALLGLSVLPFLLRIPSLGAQTVSGSGSCPGDIHITQPLDGQEVNGQTILETYVPSSWNAQEVVFLLNNNVLGGGTKFDQNWRLNFNTTSYPDGGYNLIAKVRYGTTTSACTTAGRNFFIRNVISPTATTTFDIDALPNMVDWSGPTNVSVRFGLRVYAVSATSRTEVTTMAAYAWQTSIGALTPSGNEASYFSGPYAGSGEVKVVVSYNGKSKGLSIPVQVIAAANTSAYPGEAPAASLTIKDQTSSNAPSNNTSVLEPQHQGDNELKTCLHKTLNVPLNSPTASVERLKFSEFHKAEGCFASVNFIIPSNLAPVAPAKIHDVKEDKKRVKIIKIANTPTSGKPAVVLSGVAKPNATVFIYVFSEPLVLAARTDSEGNWSYSLEDPLEPGNHEAYVAVEGDKRDEATRSQGFAFGIASTVKTKENPTGLSLLVQNRSDPKTVYGMYLLSAGSIISFAVAGVLYIDWRHKSKLKVDPLSGQINAAG